MGKLLIRIPIKLIVFNKETGEMVTSSSSRLKSRISKISAILFSQYDKNLHTFECQITYSKKNDVWTRFQYTSTNQLTEYLAQAMEADMLKEFQRDKFIDADCLPVR